MEMAGVSSSADQHLQRLQQFTTAVCFRREGGILYFAVREFDTKVLRNINTATGDDAPSEQAIRASIRQGILNMRLPAVAASKAEIQYLKSVNVLGKRAPSCSLLTGPDMVRLLKSFGKHLQADRLLASLTPENLAPFVNMPVFFLPIVDAKTLQNQQQQILQSSFYMLPPTSSPPQQLLQQASNLPPINQQFVSTSTMAPPMTSTSLPASTLLPQNPQLSPLAIPSDILAPVNSTSTTTTPPSSETCHNSTSDSCRKTLDFTQLSAAPDSLMASSFLPFPVQPWVYDNDGNPVKPKRKYTKRTQEERQQIKAEKEARREKRLIKKLQAADKKIHSLQPASLVDATVEQAVEQVVATSTKAECTALDALLFACEMSSSATDSAAALSLSGSTSPTTEHSNLPDQPQIQSPRPEQYEHSDSDNSSMRTVRSVKTSTDANASTPTSPSSPSSSLASLTSLSAASSLTSTPTKQNPAGSDCSPTEQLRVTKLPHATTTSSGSKHHSLAVGSQIVPCDPVSYDLAAHGQASGALFAQQALQSLALASPPSFTISAPSTGVQKKRKSPSSDPDLGTPVQTPRNKRKIRARDMVSGEGFSYELLHARLLAQQQQQQQSQSNFPETAKRTLDFSDAQQPTNAALAPPSFPTEPLPQDQPNWCYCGLPDCPNPAPMVFPSVVQGPSEFPSVAQGPSDLVTVVCNCGQPACSGFVTLSVPVAFAGDSAPPLQPNQKALGGVDLRISDLKSPLLLEQIVSTSTPTTAPPVAHTHRDLAGVIDNTSEIVG